MAKITICDCCGEKMRPGLRVTLVETHPHKGDEIKTDLDVCHRCGEKIKLTTRAPLPIFAKQAGEDAA